MSDIYSDDVRPAPVGAPPTVSPAIRRAAGAILFLLLVIGLAVWAYRLGTRDAAEIPIIRAMEVPPRVEPDDPGGLRAAHQGLEVNSVLAGAPPPPVTIEDAPPRLAMPTVTLAEEDGPQGELVVSQPQIPVITLPGEDEDLRMPPAEDAPPAALPRALIAGEAGGAEAEAEGEVAALIQSLGETGPADTAEEEAVAALVDPGPRPRTRPQGHVVRRNAPASEASLQPASAQAALPAAAPAAQPSAPAAQPAPPAEVTRLNPGTRLVQLGAFDSEGMARQTWSQLVARHGDLLGAKSLYLERATHNARVFYRLRVAGFQNTEETRILCERLRGRGVDCIPVTLN
jgi:hypothetical protein